MAKKNTVTVPTGTAGKNNGVGNYYHSLGFWFKTT
jgi:hypothetical protein